MIGGELPWQGSAVLRASKRAGGTRNMGRSGDFWKECIKRAKVGTAAFANDWQWFSGVPLASAVAALYASKVGVELTTGQPILDVVLAAAAAFLITWVLAFFINIWREAPQLYFEQKALANDLAERLKPKLRLSFGMNDPGCVRHNTLLANEKRGDWYRLRVDSLTEANAEHCLARLLEVRRGGSPVLVGETPRLAFAMTETPFDARVAARVPSFIDLLVVTEDNSAALALPTAFGLGPVLN